MRIGRHSQADTLLDPQGDWLRILEVRQVSRPLPKTDLSAWQPYQVPQLLAPLLPSTLFQVSFQLVYNYAQGEVRLCWWPTPEVRRDAWKRLTLPLPTAPRNYRRAANWQAGRPELPHQRAVLPQRPGLVRLTSRQLGLRENKLSFLSGFQEPFPNLLLLL